MRAFDEVCAYARAAGLLVIADGKRADIGSTARAYVAAYLQPPGADAVADALTVSRTWAAIRSSHSWQRAGGGAGIFCLVKTSNEGGADVQDLVLRDGQQLWQHVARLVGEWGDDIVGERGLERRRRRRCDAPAGSRRGAPDPAARDPAAARVGAQGATPADVARAFTSGPASALVTVSRAVMYASRHSHADWRTAAGSEPRA